MITDRTGLHSVLLLLLIVSLVFMKSRSVTCGIEVQLFERICSNPSPAHGERRCHENTQNKALSRVASNVWLRSLRNDDSNGNVNSKNQWFDWLKEEGNRAARTARFSVHFFYVVLQTTTWNSRIWGSDDNSGPQLKIFHSLPLHENMRAKQAILHFAYLVQRDQHGIITKHLP